MFAVIAVFGAGVIPVGTAGVVVGAVAFAEARLTKLKKVEPVLFEVLAFLLVEFDGFFAIAGKDGVFAFLVNVEDAVEVGVVINAFDFNGSFVNGVVVFSEGEFDLAHFSDGAGVGNRLRGFLEGELHFLAGFEVKLSGVVTHAFFIAEHGSGLDAEEGVVGFPVAVIDVVHVVCSDDLESKLGGDFEEVGDDAPLFLDAVIHQFDDEIFLAENINEAGGGLAGCGVIAPEQEAGDDGGETTGESDEALAVSGEGFEVGAGVVVEAVGVRF